MDSPPKRMTRARAAAKATEPSVKTTKIVTAAAKAKTAAASTSSATAGTKSTAAKRKTRADENDDSEDDDGHEALTVRRTRGRPKKVVESQDDDSAPAPVKAPRGRPAKKAATGASTEQPAAAPKPRGRPKKTPATEVDEPAKKTTRTRAGTVTKSGTTAAKPGVKKTVKFEEPDKENIEPTKDKEPPTASIRGRPSRRGGAAAGGGRGARAAAKTSDAGEKKPLSPKKVTQMPVSRDSSEDELAGGDNNKPHRQMKKSPVKPPSNTVAPKKSDSKPVDKESDSTDDANNEDNENAAQLMGSPPRRPPVSPLRDSMKSPAKRIGAVPLPGSTMKPFANPTEDSEHTSTFKPTLLQSAAKRPLSPIKGLSFPSASKPQNHPGSAMKTSMFQSPAKRALPGLKPLTEQLRREEPAVGESPAMKPLVMSTPTPAYASRPSQKLMAEEQTQDGLGRFEDDPFNDSVDSPHFSGRMSAVQPRFADPALGEEGEDAEGDAEEVQLVEEIKDYVESAEAVIEEAQETPVVDTQEDAGPALEEEDPMAMDEVVAEMAESTELPLREAVESPQAPREPANPMFQLRQKDLDICDDCDSGSESDDELQPSADAPGTPTPTSQKMPKNRKSGLSGLDGSRRSTIGLTSLAEQFGSWSAASPIQPAAEATHEQSVELTETPGQEDATSPPAAAPVEESPIKNSYFEDEMVVHSDVEPKDTTTDHLATEDDEVDIDVDLMVTDEDVALAHEANEMSLMESEQGEENAYPQSFDDSLSEASQEYGDENNVPIDPAMLESQPQEPATPIRPVQRSFNTTTKVPLKPADNSTPSPIKKRSFSASRVAPRRPGGITRSASVISYSPVKEKRRSSSARKQRRKSTSPPTPGPVTPTKSDMWSNMGTPARTPRKDINPSLLSGAVVFVDVHTSEGADASGIFVELLGQMGARCVKSWNWNPSSPSTRESSAKIGITHVVYKDGGKRTMEKVRETNGVVQCVGVSWVLDCERENEWLDEGPYYIDTALVPRGGARRRKSMEPLALANMNGTLVKSSGKGAPNTPLGRRQSTAWMHTPSDQGEDDQHEEDDVEWSKFILTPVPKTPAPEAIAKFAADMPETPSDAETDSSPTKQALLMQTCPPKAHAYQDMGEGILRQEKDEQVLMRLMAARRKSLQFAPKVGSPLARAWQT